jgi:hypothetical protein
MKEFEITIIKTVTVSLTVDADNLADAIKLAEQERESDVEYVNEKITDIFEA